MQKFIEPINCKIVLQLMEEEKRGSLYLPDASKIKRGFGKVIAISTDCELKNKINIGDILVFTLFDGFNVSLINDKGSYDEFTIIGEEKILGIIKEREN